MLFRSGRVHRLTGTTARRHQETNLRKTRFDFVDLVDGSPSNRLLQVLEIRASMPRLILGDQSVDVLDERLVVPFCGAAYQ